MRAQAAAEKAGGPREGVTQGPRSAPLICGYSQNLIKVPYPQLGFFAQQIGYEGLDLTVMDGGHVNPRIANVDLVRAFESVRGVGLEVPMISTTITGPNDQTAYPILAITGHTQVHLYRLGFWPYANRPGASVDVQRRLAEVRNDLTVLLALGRNYQMTAMFPNRAGAFVGEALWDAQSIIGDMDPQWIGYYFDPSQATAEGGVAGWEIALRLALPRLKAVAVQDFTWARNGTGWKMQMCPMGQGVVDWVSFFQILAEARFTGPVSIHQEYAATDEPAAMNKDLEFVRAHVKRAWGSPPGVSN
ncbi:MAG: sugar phosphate isomerase/epimerase [Acidobacteriota bacterium]|nr:sugar phosphate isomerase/epimerase [Acidobacteriota bacterium]